MADLKIIIPMAGTGKRMGLLTRHAPKALVPLAHQRLLDHVLDVFQELDKAYALEYIFIVGYLGEQIKQHMHAAHPNKKVRYYMQEQLLGQSHAVHLAREAIAGPVFLTYCDTINETDFSFLPLRALDGVAFVQEVADPRRHGVAAIGPDNLLVKLVEKPQTMEYKVALTGLYYFSEGRDLIKAIEGQMQNRRSLNNEYYLADAINILLENGMRIGAHYVSQWHDAGTPEALLETNAYLLRHRSGTRSGAACGPSNVLISPVYIHPSSCVENSTIGPGVSIGKNSAIDRSTLRNAIVDDNCNLTDVVLVNSLVGKGCSMAGVSSQPMLSDEHEVHIYGAAGDTDPPAHSAGS